MKSWKFFLRNKFSSVVNTIGLALGLSATILIAIWVDSETDFDSFHLKKDNIYRILSDGTTYMEDGFPVSPGKLGVIARDRLPEVKNQTRIFVGSDCVFYRGDDAIKSGYGIIVDPEFFEIFSFPILRGNPDTWLEDPNSIILTESLGRKIFGDDDPVGEALKVDGNDFKVTGILKDIPVKSHLKFQYVGSMANFENVAEHWGSFAFNTYLELTDSPDIVTIENSLTEIGIENRCPQVIQDSLVFKLQPLKEVYLDTPMKAAWPYLKSGERKTITTFLIIALVILLIACINFLNFSLVNMDSRSKEIGIKRVLGAGKKRIFIDGSIEAGFQILIASVLAFLIASLCYPLIENFSGKEIEYHIGLNLLKYVAPALVICFLVSAVYPSLLLSGRSGALVINRNAKILSGGSRIFNLRSVMLLFQMIVSGVLIFVSSMLIRQTVYVNNTDMGFSPESVYCIKLNSPSQENYRVIRDRLLNNPSVNFVSSSDYLWVSMNDRCGGCIRWEGMDPDFSPEIRKAAVGYDYFRLMNVDIIEGRDFGRDYPGDASGSFLINESAKRLMGIDDVIGTKLVQSGIRRIEQRGEIVGVFSDFNYKSLKEPVQPMVVRLMNDSSACINSQFMYISVGQESSREIMKDFESVWSEINGEIPFECNLLRDLYNDEYASDRKSYQLLIAFTLIAILISSLGMIGLVMFINERRQKEIGIRKVFGSDVINILSMQTKIISGILLFSLLISVPLSVIFVRKLLSEYAYRVDADWYFYILVIAGLFISVVSLVIAQSVKSARLNPIDTLRVE